MLGAAGAIAPAWPPELPTASQRGAQVYCVTWPPLISATRSPGSAPTTIVRSKMGRPAASVTTRLVTPAPLPVTIRCRWSGTDTSAIAGLPMITLCAGPGSATNADWSSGTSRLPASAAAGARARTRERASLRMAPKARLDWSRKAERRALSAAMRRLPGHRVGDAVPQRRVRVEERCLERRGGDRVVVPLALDHRG